MTCQIAAWHALVLLILGRMCLPNLPENGFRKKAKPLVLGCPSFVFLTHPQHWHALGVEDIPPSCILPRYVREVRQCPSAAPRTLCPWHGAAIISWALWSPRALAKASCSVGPVAWRTSLWCPDLADWGGLQGLMRLYRWLYTILINIDYTILYTIYYTHLYSLYLSCQQSPILLQDLPCSPPWIQIAFYPEAIAPHSQHSLEVKRKRPRSDSVLADRRTGFWLLSCGSLSSLDSLATCESASCTTSALWIYWWFMMVCYGLCCHHKQTIITIIYWWFIMAPPWFMMVCWPL